MTLLQAIILGLIQGLTEFLPVSSSGHLTLVQRLFGLESDLTFDVMVHVGSLAAVFAAMWGDIVPLIKKPVQKTTGLLIVGTIPAVAAALLFGDVIDALYEGRPLMLAAGFAVTAVLLVCADIVTKRNAKIGNDKAPSWLDALIVGVFQAVAITPGISRSGATITGGLIRGVNRDAAARFAFLLSIPAVLGAFVLEGRKLIGDSAALAGVNWLNYGLGALAAALSGYLAINFMLSVVRKAQLKWFSLYVLIAAIVTIIWA